MYTKTKGRGKLVSSAVQSCTYSSPVPVFPFSQNRKKIVEGDTPTSFLTGNHRSPLRRKCVGGTSISCSIPLDLKDLTACNLKEFSLERS